MRTRKRAQVFGTLCIDKRSIGSHMSGCQCENDDGSNMHYTFLMAPEHSSAGEVGSFFDMNREISERTRQESCAHSSATGRQGRHRRTVRSNTGLKTEKSTTQQIQRARRTKRRREIDTDSTNDRADGCKWDTHGPDDQATANLTTQLSYQADTNDSGRYKRLRTQSSRHAITPRVTFLFPGENRYNLRFVGHLPLIWSPPRR